MNIIRGKLQKSDTGKESSYAFEIEDLGYDRVAVIVRDSNGSVCNQGECKSDADSIVPITRPYGKLPSNVYSKYKKNKHFNTGVVRARNHLERYEL